MDYIDVLISFLHLRFRLFCKNNEYINVIHLNKSVNIYDLLSQGVYHQIYDSSINLEYRSWCGETMEGRILMRILRSDHTPREVGPGLFQCSVPHYHLFSPLLACNLVQECIHDDDERDCKYRSDNCEGEQFDTGYKCWSVVPYGAHAATSWQKSQDHCINRNQTLITLSHPSEYDLFRLIVETFAEDLALDDDRLGMATFVGLQALRQHTTTDSYRFRMYNRVFKWINGITAFHISNEFKYPIEVEYVDHSCAKYTNNGFYMMECTDHGTPIITLGKIDLVICENLYHKGNRDTKQAIKSNVFNQNKEISNEENNEKKNQDTEPTVKSLESNQTVEIYLEKNDEYLEKNDENRHTKKVKQTTLKSTQQNKDVEISFNRNKYSLCNENDYILNFLLCDEMVMSSCKFYNNSEPSVCTTYAVNLQMVDDISKCRFTNNNRTEESDCATRAVTTEMFKCTETLKLIHYTFVCDHQPQCDDGTDERFCVYPQCPLSAFQCHSGHCIRYGLPAYFNLPPMSPLSLPVSHRSVHQVRSPRIRQHTQRMCFSLSVGVFLYECGHGFIYFKFKI